MKQYIILKGADALAAFVARAALVVYAIAALLQGAGGVVA